MIQAIFFDFNGVVIDDEKLQFKAYQEALAAHDISLTEEDYFKSLGMNDTAFIRANLSRVNMEYTDELAADIYRRKFAAHRKMIEADLPLFPGVVTLVKEAARRYPLGVVSMARRGEIEYVLERATLLDQFNLIVSADDVHTHKPDPACYVRAHELLNEKNAQAQRANITADSCLVIEDTPPGILAARGAGMRTVGVTNTVAEKGLRAAGADIVTANLADWNVDAVHHLFD